MFLLIIYLINSMIDINLIDKLGIEFKGYTQKWIY